MAYIAYTLIAIGLILHGYNSVTDKLKREIRSTVMLRQYVTLLFLVGTIVYGFVQPFTGYGFILLTFIVMTVLSSVMYGLNMSIYLEDNEQYISKTLEKRRNNR